jgi:hypothetical protein
MMIRLAETSDLDTILAVYGIAREYMAENGNAGQWGDAYPPVELLMSDIQAGQLFAITEDSVIHGVFAFIIGSDPTYAYIENGAWKNDEPYGTIHRIASDGAVKGVFSQCIEFCRSHINNLRIDTHEDNQIMNYLIPKHGFEKCGIIYTESNDPRIAYQST